MAEVVDLSQHLPTVDKELVDCLRSLLSEAQNGRLRSYAAIYISGDGESVERTHYVITLADQLALNAVVPGIILTED